MAAKRAMQAITHATGMKYDCPIVIMPIKSKKPAITLSTQKGTVIASTMSKGRHNTIREIDRRLGICFIYLSTSILISQSIPPPKME